MEDIEELPLDSLNRKVSRRDALKILALAGASAAALFGLPRIDPYLFDKPPKACFDYKITKPYERTAKYIAPNSGEEISFSNLSTDPENEDTTLNAVKRFLGYRVPQPLSSSWYVDDRIAARTKDYSAKLPPGEHKVRLNVYDGRLEDSVEKKIDVDPESLPE